MVDLQRDEVGRQRGKTIVTPFRRAVFNAQTVPVGVTQVPESTLEDLETSQGLGWQLDAHARDSSPCLLRLGGKRRGEEGASYSADERPTLHHWCHENGRALLLLSDNPSATVRRRRRPRS
jgi:hypothetical protein